MKELKEFYKSIQDVTEEHYLILYDNFIAKTGYTPEYLANLYEDEIQQK